MHQGGLAFSTHACNASPVLISPAPGLRGSIHKSPAPGVMGLGQNLLPGFLKSRSLTFLALEKKDSETRMQMGTAPGSSSSVGAVCVCCVFASASS